MNMWTALLDVLILLFAAMVLGGIFERLRQNAILGYLLAGTLLGPHAFDLIPNHQAIAAIAEIGVALLLFAIGLEFSWRKLRSIGVIALGGGILQIVLTSGFAACSGLLFGLDLKSALVIGAAVSLSSTAVVMRLLTDRTELESIHGRNALGILLLQDIAVVPLVLGVIFLAEGRDTNNATWALFRSLGYGLLFAGILFVLLKFALPRLLQAKVAALNRELPILLAIVTALGCAWGSHTLGLSPVLGAFIGGLFLAESPFATQIRADVGSLKTLFLTLFFASIGMLTNPTWIIENWLNVATLAIAIVIGKLILTSTIVRLFRYSTMHAFATGACLAQIGEFSFVISIIAKDTRLFSNTLFETIVAVTVITLFTTPFLVENAKRIGQAAGRVSALLRKRSYLVSDSAMDEPKVQSNHIVIIGFGPAGKKVAEELLDAQESLVLVELKVDLVREAQNLDIKTVIGDATQIETLHEVNVESAKAVIVTVPDPETVNQITTRIRASAPAIPIIARARYHRFRNNLQRAGASAIVDEEVEVGLRIVSELYSVLSSKQKT